MRGLASEVLEMHALSSMKRLPSSSAAHMQDAFTGPMPGIVPIFPGLVLNREESCPLQLESSACAVSTALIPQLPLPISMARSSPLLRLPAPRDRSFSRGLSLSHRSFIFIVCQVWLMFVAERWPRLPLSLHAYQGGLGAVQHRHADQFAG